MREKSESEVAQSCSTLLDPMDCSPPGSSLYGIFQARVLEWGAIAFSDQYATFSKRASLVSQTVKNLPALQKIWLLSLGQEDLLEKRMTTHSKILAWRIPWIEEPGRL